MSSISEVSIFERKKKAEKEEVALSFQNKGKNTASNKKFRLFCTFPEGSEEDGVELWMVGRRKKMKNENTHTIKKKFFFGNRDGKSQLALCSLLANPCIFDPKLMQKYFIKKKKKKKKGFLLVVCVSVLLFLLLVCSVRAYGQNLSKLPIFFGHDCRRWIFFCLPFSFRSYYCIAEITSLTIVNDSWTMHGFITMIFFFLTAWFFFESSVIVGEAVKKIVFSFSKPFQFFSKPFQFFRSSKAVRKPNFNFSKPFQFFRSPFSFFEANKWGKAIRKANFNFFLPLELFLARLSRKLSFVFQSASYFCENFFIFLWSAFFFFENFMFFFSFFFVPS